MPYNWSEIGVEIPYNTKGPQVKVFCPFCHSSRKPEHQREKEMSINLNDGAYNCHNCGRKGYARQIGAMYSDEKWMLPVQQKTYSKPQPLPPQGYSEAFLNYFKWRGIDEDTLEKAGVREGVTYMPSVNKEMDTIQFAYYLNGEHVCTKFRTHDKHFKCTAGARMVPYNIDSIKGSADCIITEGEIDALSFIQIGFEHVISVPHGANEFPSKYIAPIYDEFFKDKTTIYIAPDTDKPGQALKDKLIMLFGKERCSVIEYEDGCKDANDVLKKFGAEALASCMKAAAANIQGGYSIADFKDKLDSLFLHGLQPGKKIGLNDFDKLCTFETKRLCIVTGIPGSGKSEFIDEMCVRFSLLHNWRIAYFSPENLPLEYHGSKLLSKIIGKAFSAKKIQDKEYEEAVRYANDNFFFINPDSNSRIETLLGISSKYIQSKGIKCLVIDPYNRIEFEETNEQETSRISRLLDKLTAFAVHNDILIILMAHPTKLPKNKQGFYDAPTLYDISGSAHFFNKADFGIVVHRNRQIGLTEVHIQKVKFRHLGHTGICYFKYNEENGRYTPTFEVKDYNSSIPEEMKAKVKIDRDGEKIEATLSWKFDNDNFLHKCNPLTVPQQENNNDDNEYDDDDDDDEYEYKDNDYDGYEACPF